MHDDHRLGVIRKTILFLLIVGVPVWVWLVRHVLFSAWLTALPNVNLAFARRRFYVFSFPCILILVGEVIGVWWLLRYSPRRIERIRRTRGLCAKCGYSLRGLLEPRCPECGTPFDPAPVPDKEPNTNGRSC